MAVGWRFFPSLLWLCFTILRASQVCEIDLDDNPELLFTPRHLFLRSPLAAALCSWREKSHLSPHLQVRPWTSRRRPFVVPNCYWLLLLAGDVERNPGPVKYPCTDCSKPVTKNQRGILCDICDKWTHASCCRISREEY